MLSSAIKKYAGSHGFVCTHGIAYGNLNGYTLTLKDGAGTKFAAFSIYCPSETTQEQLRGFLSNPENTKKYRLASFDVSAMHCKLLFTDTIGTFPKMVEFLDVAAAKLQELRVPGSDTCPCCGMAIQPGSAKRYLLLDTVDTLHPRCAERLAGELEESAAEVRSEGSTLSGLMGAILGGVIGAIPWAFAYYFNWFASILGLLVGIAAEKGYNLAHGKMSKLKIPIVILVSALCIVLAQYVSLGVYLAVEYDVSVTGALASLFIMLTESSETFIAFAWDVLVGWFFAGLGIFSSVARMRRESKVLSAKPIELE